MDHGTTSPPGEGQGERLNRRLRWSRVAFLVAIVALSLGFWQSPGLLPLKLLAVMGHETGHALGTLLAGGAVEQITLRPNESGQCLSRIPDGFFARALVYSSGYVGSALIATVLLLLTFRFGARRLVLALACAWLTLTGVFAARDGFTLAFCLVMAAAFAAAARWLPDGAVGLVNLTLASFTALYAAVDLKDDLWNSTVRASSDAQLLADVTPLPALVWAALWTALSVCILALGAWFSIHDTGGIPSEARRPRG